jgi:hypothetical protein
MTPPVDVSFPEFVIPSDAITEEPRMPTIFPVLLNRLMKNPLIEAPDSL